ncbi:MAG: hypothetical protein Q7Q71_06030 [Verrucomicrobiota bacterium JB023]|nr:hypothetical protein [Verrucomicrobiota bacterium JB023]
MNWLTHLTNGNLPGLFGMLLFAFAGFRLIKRQAVPGLMLSAGALFVFSSRVFTNFIVPKIEYDLVMSFSPAEIAIVNMVPAVAMTLGSLFVVFGFLLMNLRAKELEHSLVIPRHR